MISVKTHRQTCLFFDQNYLHTNYVPLIRYKYNLQIKTIHTPPDKHGRVVLLSSTFPVYSTVHYTGQFTF